MAREIKFRIRDKDTGKIYQSHEICRFHFSEGLFYAVLLWTGELILHPQPMEWTGLKDKNGTEIYEGDLVRMANPYTSKSHGSEVMFVYAQFAIIADHNFIPLGDVTNWEVIGNIYENPELLEA